MLRVLLKNKKVVVNHNSMVHMYVYAYMCEVAQEERTHGKDWFLHWVLGM